MAREAWTEVSFQVIREMDGTIRSGWFPTGTGTVNGNVAVDFVWGNFPLQPDDDRNGVTTAFGGGTGDEGWSATSYKNSGVLRTIDYVVEFNNVGGEVSVPADNHINATTAYNGFPAYTPVAPYTDTVANTIVPDVTGLTQVAATAALVAAELVLGTVTTSTVGATVENDGLVRAQSIAEATVVNVGTAVNVVLFDYVAP